MNVDTGRIVNLTEKETEESLAQLVAIRNEDMNRKQRREKQVSLHDHRSVLGQQLTKERADRGLTKNRYRKLRRKGKLS